MADLSALRIRGTLPADAASLVTRGLAVEILPRGAEPLPGKISSVLPALDAESHRLPIEVVVDPVDRQGLANAFVRVRVEAPQSLRAAKIPATSLVRGTEISVFTVDEQGRAVRVVVDVLASEGAWTVVRGVETGSEIVDLPPVDLEEGAQVRR